MRRYACGLPGGDVGEVGGPSATNLIASMDSWPDFADPRTASLLSFCCLNTNLLHLYIANTGCRLFRVLNTRVIQVCYGSLCLRTIGLDLVDSVCKSFHDQRQSWFLPVGADGRPSNTGAIPKDVGLFTCRQGEAERRDESSKGDLYL